MSEKETNHPALPEKVTEKKEENTPGEIPIAARAKGNLAR